MMEISRQSEAARLLRLKGVEPANLPEEDFDSPLGTGSGGHFRRNGRRGSCK